MTSTMHSTATKDAAQAPRSLVTCRNCGNSGWDKEFTTPQGTLECGDCGQTRYFKVEVEGGCA